MLQGDAVPLGTVPLGTGQMWGMPWKARSDVALPLKLERQRRDWRGGRLSRRSLSAIVEQEVQTRETLHRINYSGSRLLFPTMLADDSGDRSDVTDAVRDRSDVVKPLGTGQMSQDARMPLGTGQM
jgi:hypothetical protein